MLINKHLIIIILLGLPFFSLSQINLPGGTSCNQAGPICSSNTGIFVFKNNNDSSTDITSRIACLGNGPRPAWFFLQIDQNGTLEFEINQWEDINGDGVNNDGPGSGLDVDFVVWGPFSSDTGNCVNIEEDCRTCPNNTNFPNYYLSDLDGTNIVDCSYSLLSTERMTILNAQSGEYYLLLVTNFRGGDGLIEIVQTNFGTSGTGSTNCDIVNVDGILGPDQSICNSTTTTLNANPNNAPDFVDFAWAFDDGSGYAPLTGITNSTLTFPTDVEAVIGSIDAGSFKIQVTITNASGDTDSDEVEIGFTAQPIANPIPPQKICDDNNDGLWTFILSDFDAFVLGTQDGNQYHVRYYRTQGDADSGKATEALPNSYTNQSPYTDETIFARIENNDNADCFNTIRFTIDVFDTPEVTDYSYPLCDNADNGSGDTDTDGSVVFDLDAVISNFLLSPNTSQFNIRYYETQPAADSSNASQEITSPLYTASRQVVVRIENIDNADCYNTAVIDLVVNPIPVVTNVDLFQCDDDTADGFSVFNLKEAETLISSDAANETFTYYSTNATDADTAASNFIANTRAYTNTDPSSTPDTLYVRVENSDTGCHRVAQLDLHVTTSQIPDNVMILYAECDEEGDITDGIKTFDFSDAEAQIRTVASLPTGQALTFTYYETEADALAESNAIRDTRNYVNSTSPFSQDIYVRIDGVVDNNCVGLGVHVRLQTINPTPRTNPPLIERCDDSNLPRDLIVNDIDLTQNETYIFSGDSNFLEATYHNSYTNAFNNDFNTIPFPQRYTNIDDEEIIYVRVTNPITTCFVIVEQRIKVNPLPDTAPITDFLECENNTNFEVTFDLTSKIPEILNGQDLNDFEVTFYESAADADSEFSPIPNPDRYTNRSNPQPIFVAIKNTDTGCRITGNNLISADALFFNIEVEEDAQANSDGVPLVYEICDETNENDGFAQFDLSTLDDDIYDGQDPRLFSITYHYSEDDALNNTQPLPTRYENLETPQQVIYARVSNNISPNECFAIAEVTLQVNLLPIFDLQDEYILCLTSTDDAVVETPPLLETGLSENDYTFAWFYEGELIEEATTSQLYPNRGGTYSVIVTDISTSAVTLCANFDETEVIESDVPDTFSVSVSSEAFTGNNMLLAAVTGNSTYEFSLDNGPWQLEEEFSDVSGGSHTVYVRDVNGCGILSTDVTVIDYLNFFTPNGDGVNEAWTIKGIDTQPQAVIYIFNRYGKLLKQLSPTSPGWDGTYNGVLMPPGDYWFSLEYTEPLRNERRTYKSHFSLKL